MSEQRYYLIHLDGRHKVCETEKGAIAAECEGFRRVTYAAYRAAWDAQSIQRQRELGALDDDLERTA